MKSAGTLTESAALPGVSQAAGRCKTQLSAFVYTGARVLREKLATGARIANDLYEEIKSITVEERIRLFSLSLAEVHRELQESITHIETMLEALQKSEQNHANW